MSAVPGVAAAGVNSGLHPMGNMWTAAEVAGEAASTDPVKIHNISADYTDAVGIRLAGGTAADGGGRRTAPQPVALVNERFVRARLTGRDAARPDRPASAAGEGALLPGERRRFRSWEWCTTR